MNKKYFYVMDEEDVENDDNKYRSAGFVDRKAFLQMRMGSSTKELFLAKYRPLEMRWWNGEGNLDKDISDLIPGTGPDLLFSTKAGSVLKNIINEYGLALDLALDGSPVVGFMSWNKFDFLADATGEFFRLKNEDASIIVSEDIKRLVEENALIGFRFVPVPERLYSAEAYAAYEEKRQKERAAKDAGSRKKPSVVISDIDQDTANALTELLAESYNLIKVDKDDEPKAIVKAIDDFVQDVQKKAELDENAKLDEDDIFRLSALLAEQYRRALNWRWGQVDHNDGDGFMTYVLSPDNGTAYDAIATINRQCNHGHEVTILLAFNMAISGEQPGEPGYAVVFF